MKTARDLLERDEEGRKRIADILASEIALRSRTVEAVLKEVATKDDLKELEKRIKEYVDLKIEGLGNEIGSLEKSWKCLQGFPLQRL